MSPPASPMIFLSTPKTTDDDNFEFLSTPSARRATRRRMASLHPIVFLSTPSARRATDDGRNLRLRCAEFLSTPSARRATDAAKKFFALPIISIHALREEGDNTDQRKMNVARHFYPRPPRGGRRYHTEYQLGIEEFLSTPSARRATQWCVLTRRTSKISIHALREEGDWESHF